MSRTSISVFLVASVVAALALSSIASASHRVVGRGRITITGPWTSSRTLTVALDRDAPDGFFLEAPRGGTSIGTQTVDRAGLGYDIVLNFHAGSPRGLGPRQWLGGCSNSAPEERDCKVPDGAGTVEVTSTRGADLEVVVFFEHPRSKSER